jgi:hypothetical protein
MPHLDVAALLTDHAVPSTLQHADQICGTERGNFTRLRPGLARPLYSAVAPNGDAPDPLRNGATLPEEHWREALPRFRLSENGVAKCSRPIPTFFGVANFEER